MGTQHFGGRRLVWVCGSVQAKATFTECGSKAHVIPTRPKNAF